MIRLFILFLCTFGFILQSHIALAASDGCSVVFSDKNNTNKDSKFVVKNWAYLLPPPLQKDISTTIIESVYFSESNPASIFAGAGSAQLYKMNFSSTGKLLNIETIMNQGPETSFATIHKNGLNDLRMNYFGNVTSQGALLGSVNKKRIQIVMKDKVKTFENIPFIEIDYDINAQKNFAVLSDNRVVSYSYTSGEIQQKQEPINQVSKDLYGQVTLYRTSHLGELQLTSKHLFLDEVHAQQKIINVQDLLPKEIITHFLENQEKSFFDAIATENSYWVILQNKVKQDVSKKLESMSLVQKMEIDSEGKVTPTKIKEVVATHRLAVNLTPNGEVIGLQFIPFNYNILGSIHNDLIIWRTHDKSILKLGKNRSELLLQISHSGIEEYGYENRGAPGIIQPVKVDITELLLN